MKKSEMKKSIKELKIGNCRLEALEDFYGKTPDFKTVASGCYKIVAVFEKEVIKIDKDKDSASLTELFIYSKAKELGLEKFFAKPTFLGLSTKETFCISMPTVKVACDVVYNSPRISSEINNKIKAIPKDILACLLLNRYKETEILELDRFFMEYNIRDFHSGNWGIDRNFRVKFIDYAINSSDWKVREKIEEFKNKLFEENGL